MTSTGEAVREAAQRIAGVSDTPRLDAELLMAHAMGVERTTLLLARLDDPVPPGFAALVEARLSHTPVAYLTGRRAFWTIELEVGPGALVPRADSETLIEAAVAHFVGRAPATVLDLGTGPGTLLLAALDEWPQARGVGVDRSVQALGYARRNAERLDMARRAQFALGDWATALDGRFDLVLANPPYIGTDEALPQEVVGHEPAGALFAGGGGLDAYRLLAPQIARLIAPGGVAVVEIGWTQADAVSALLANQGLLTSVKQDLAGRPRAVVAG
ncbi:peptide chain release factor N(5)-glutamine methyltransferase [Sphingomonas sp. ac-8]|uniref:peptide chain release factor N(5)-glutamine methyltransferase n=1 Tax=Sphingomonas sp. ac-8 TaxID=3242977 RepID=UPI003A80AE00